MKCVLALVFAFAVCYAAPAPPPEDDSEDFHINLNEVVLQAMDEIFLDNETVANCPLPQDNNASAWSNFADCVNRTNPLGVQEVAEALNVSAHDVFTHSKDLLVDLVANGCDLNEVVLDFANAEHDAQRLKDDDFQMLQFLLSPPPAAREGEEDSDNELDEEEKDAVCAFGGFTIQALQAAKNQTSGDAVKCHRSSLDAVSAFLEFVGKNILECPEK